MVGLITNKLDNVLIIRNLFDTIGGEGGIRTLGEIAPTLPFQGSSIGRSDTSPFKLRRHSFSRARIPATHPGTDSTSMSGFYQGDLSASPDGSAAGHIRQDGRVEDIVLKPRTIAQIVLLFNSFSDRVPILSGPFSAGG
jgi:hypothetical protein